MKRLLFLIVLCATTLFANAQVDTLAQQHPEYLPTLAVGEIAPDFTAADTIGNKISLSDYRGKYVVLDFWATWCPDCRREIPQLKALYQEKKDQQINGTPVQWISLSFDTKADAWKNLLRKEQFPWPQVSNLKSTREDPTFNNFKLHWIPAFLVLDPKGAVVATAITAEGLKIELDKLK